MGAADLRDDEVLDDEADQQQFGQVADRTRQPPVALGRCGRAARRPVARPARVAARAGT